MPKTAWIDLGNGRRRLIPDVDAYLARPDARAARSDYPTPHFRTDTMPLLMNHAVGRPYDSKSAFERAVEEESRRRVDVGGSAIVIAGNEKLEATPFEPNSEDIKRDIKLAYDKVVGA